MTVSDDYKILEYEGVPNIQVVNGRKVFNCTLCGECCHIRENKGITSEDEQKYREFMYAKFGIIYLARLNDITINIWPEEAEILKQEAKEKKINIKLVPKRVIYDKLHHEIIILDYFIDHDICPFFNKKDRLCSVYKSRPIICHSYPLLTTKNLGKCSYKLEDPRDYDSEMIAAEKLDKMIGMQKNVIKQMIETKKIKIPESITPMELDSILRTAKFKELRIMDKM
jgi:Fe-S-cluster containining protein